MPKKRSIMIIGAGILQVPAILEAKKLGLKVAAIDMDATAPGFKYADMNFTISTIDIETAVAKAREIGPDGVMTLASDIPIRTVTAIAKDLGLNAISEETAIFATNKGKMRECLKENGVSVPEFYVTDSYSEFLDAVKNFNGKFIVKPADNSGSRGVFLANSDCNLKEVHEYSKEYSRSGEVLVEEYMSGPEVSVETLTVNGQTHVIAVTDKLTTGAPNFVEMGHSIPSSLPTETIEAIGKAACAAVKAIGIDKGPSHTEIIVTENGPKIVELGARLGGDNITTHLVPLATGVNMVESCICIALGMAPDITPKFSKGAAIRYFKCSEGQLVTVEGEKAARALPGIREIKIIKKIRDIITPIRSSTDRIGFVIAQAETPIQAIEICNKAMEMVKINIAY